MHKNIDWSCGWTRKDTIGLIIFLAVALFFESLVIYFISGVQAPQNIKFLFIASTLIVLTLGGLVLFKSFEWVGE